MLEATVTSLLPDWPSLTPEARRQVSHHCAAFVRRQISLAPAHIRGGFWLLYATFIVFAAVRALARGSLAPRGDAAALTAFASLGPASFPGLERVLRSMTVLAFLEHPVVQSSLGDDGRAT
jgi:hypothetical protein